MRTVPSSAVIYVRHGDVIFHDSIADAESDLADWFFEGEHGAHLFTAEGGRVAPPPGTSAPDGDAPLRLQAALPTAASRRDILEALLAIRGDWLDDLEPETLEDAVAILAHVYRRQTRLHAWGAIRCRRTFRRRMRAVLWAIVGATVLMFTLLVLFTRIGA